MRSSLLNRRTLTTGLAALALTAVLGTEANAQISITAGSLTYAQNFNTLDTASATSSGNLPTGWEIYEYGTSATVNGEYKGGNGSSNAGDVYSYGSTGSTERALGSLLSSSNKEFFGAKFTNNTGAAITSIAVSYTGEQWRRGAPTSNVADTLVFRYSTIATTLSDTATANWTRVNSLNFFSPNTTATASTALDGNATGNNAAVSGTVTVSIPAGATFYLAWMDKDAPGTDEGLSVDDLSITFTTGTVPPPTHITIISKTPTGTNVPLATNTLHIKYDNPLAAGAGNVELFKTSVPGTPVATFDVTTAAVVINTDSSVTINGMALENNTSYFVNMPAGAFTKTGGTLPNEAVTGTSAWTFSTVDTTTPPPPTPMTTLDETFANCNFPAMGVFVQYSVAGTKTWRCSSRNVHGSTDTFSVYINGGSAPGTSEANEDWLISKAPFNFSAMTAPELSLWQYRHFEGNVTRAVKISTNYIPGSNPNSANWTTLTVPAMGTTPTVDTWDQISGIDLTAYKSSPFYIAFTYNCGTDGAYELTYDDIKVQEKTVGIFGTQRGQIGLQVLGDATPNAIQLGISLQKSADLTAQIFDMTGRKVYSQALKASNGRGVYTLANTGLRAGTYVIRISNGIEFGAIKAMVK